MHCEPHIQDAKHRFQEYYSIHKNYITAEAKDIVNMQTTEMKNQALLANISNPAEEVSGR